MINTKRLLDEFLELVSISSQTENERQVADLLTAKLQAMGLSVYEDQVNTKIGGNAGNLFATLKGVAGLPRTVFMAHMDTVPPCEVVKPIVKDGVICTDGTTVLGGDNKSGIAAILEAVRSIQEQGIAHGDVQIVFTVAEETGLKGSKNLDPSLLNADLGFAVDSTGPAGEFVITTPGMYILHFEIKGKAAHAGVVPENGINAVLAAAKAIACTPQGRIDEETTANLGMISGGSAINTVADYAKVSGEARSRSAEKLEQQVQTMVDCFTKVCREMGAELTITKDKALSPYLLTEQDQIYQVTAQAITDIGLTPVAKLSSGGSDANSLNEFGIPSTVLATGQMKGHTTEEYIEIKHLNQTAEIIFTIIKNLAKKG